MYMYIPHVKNIERECPEPVLYYPMMCGQCRHIQPDKISKFITLHVYIMKALNCITRLGTTYRCTLCKYLLTHAWCSKGPKTGRIKLIVICILAFSWHYFRTEGLIEKHKLKQRMLYIQYLECKQERCCR